MQAATAPHTDLIVSLLCLNHQLQGVGQRGSLRQKPAAKPQRGRGVLVSLVRCDFRLPAAHSGSKCSF